MTARTSKNALRLTWRRVNTDLWWLQDAAGVLHARLAYNDENHVWVWDTSLPGYVKETGDAKSLQAGRAEVRKVFDRQSWQEYAYRVETVR